MKSTRPNFLFLFPDQWRWDWIGPLGKVPVKTPNLDKLAAKGLRFDQLRVNCPLCAPSRAGLATARRYHRAGVRNNGDELNPSLPNMFRSLSEGGYQVLTTGKSDLHTVSEHFDPSGWHPHLAELGFTGACDQAGKWRSVNLMSHGRHDAYGTHLREHDLEQPYLQDMESRHQQRKDNVRGRISTEASPLPTHACTDDFCGRRSVELLRSAATDQPWLMWVNFPGPHEPFDPPAEFQQPFIGVEFPEPLDRNESDGEDHQGIRQNYAAMIAHIDHWIGQLLKTIEERGESDNTIFIIASDHGELLGDHGIWYKRSSYEASVHVPLIISGLGIPEGKGTEALVELVDIGPTILDLAGLKPLPESDGRSFVPVIDDPASAHRRFTISACDDWRMIFNGRYKLTEWKDGTVRLWDLSTDPDELTDLSKQPESKKPINELHDILQNESPWFPGELGDR